MKFQLKNFYRVMSKNKSNFIVLFFITALILFSCSKKIHSNIQEKNDNICLINFRIVTPNNYQINMYGISENFNDSLLGQLDYRNSNTFITSFYKKFYYTIDAYLINDSFICDDITLDYNETSIIYKKGYKTEMKHGLELQKGEVHFSIYPINKGNNLIKIENLNCLFQNSDEANLDSLNINKISFVLIDPNSGFYP